MADPWQQAKYDLYLAIFTTATQMYELSVWPGQPGENPADTAGFTGELAAVTRRLAFLAPAPIAAAATGIRDSARAFAAVIEDLRRDSGGRPRQGALAGPVLDRYESAQRVFGQRIDQFAVLARPDIGITDDYLRLAPGPDA
jgi:hypothetical protein